MNNSLTASVAICLLIVLNFISCGQSTSIEQTPTPETIGEPRPRKVTDVPPELLPLAEQNLPSEDIESLTTQTARIETIEVLDIKNSPKLRLRGYLPDGATQLEEPQFSTQNGILYIRINTKRDDEVMASMAIIPFDITIDLPHPLPAQILLNGAPVISSLDP